MNKDYDFDLLVSEEEFKKNKEIERKRREITKLNRSKNNIILSSVLLFVFLLLMFTTFLSIKNFDMNASVCDAEKGYTCSYYEVMKSVR